MTLEELFDCSAEKLMAMSDEELRKHFEPYFHITRPEIAGQRKGQTVQSVDPVMAAKLKQLQALGINVDLTRKKKK